MADGADGMKLEEIRALCEAASKEDGMLIYHGDARSKLHTMSRDVLPKLVRVAEAAKRYRAKVDYTMNRDVSYHVADEQAQLDKALAELEGV